MLTAYVGTLGQAVGVQREFSGLIWWGNGQIRYGGLTILDWTNLVIIAGCVQTIAIRLVRILRALRTKEQWPGLLQKPEVP